MTVGELLGRMSSQELTEWQEYERVTGPLGQRRDDVLATRTAYYIARVLGADVKMDKMLPDWDPQPQPWEHMQTLLKAVTVAHGGTIEG